MHDKNQQSMDELLQSLPSSQFGKVLAHAQYLRQINHAFLTLLDSELRSVCQVANLTADCLVVHIINAAWLTRLRFLTPSLIKQMRTVPRLASVQNIRWRIMPVTTPVSQSEVTNTLTMSATSAEIISLAASGIKDDGLRLALEKLASHGKKD